MKKILCFFTMALLMLCINAQAADLQWNHSDIAITDGYVVYFNESGQTDTPYNKTMPKTVLSVVGETVTMTGFEPVLNLQIGQAYDLWVVAYNVAGASGPSNTVQYMIEGYTPPGDSLPSGTVIEIPNAAVTIRVP